MTRAEGVTVAQPLFQEAGRGSIPTSALNLWLVKVGFDLAKNLNRLWHSRLPRFGTGCIKKQPFLCYAAEFEGIYYAAAIWSNPVARMLPQQTWLELRRLAIGPDSPRNTASRMLGVMARLVRVERPEVVKLISYQDLDAHTGTIYRAAGWKQTQLGVGGEWSCKTRPRPKNQSASPKQRWEKDIA